jgi:hypothetical protein
MSLFLHAGSKPLCLGQAEGEKLARAPSGVCSGPLGREGQNTHSQLCCFSFFPVPSCLSSPHFLVLILLSLATVPGGLSDFQLYFYYSSLLCYLDTALTLPF